MRIKIKFVIFLGLIIGINLRAASIEIFPADLRQDKTVYCIGDELNPVHFIIFSDRACGGKPGRHLMPDFSKNIKTADISFSVDVPENITCPGLLDMRESTFDSEDKTEKITIDNVKYIRHTIPLQRDVLISRVVKGRHRYDINLWLKMPKDYQGNIKWRLLKNGKELVSADNNIKTVGTVTGMTPTNSGFKFFLTYPELNLPEEIIDSRIKLYKKMGVTDIAFIYRGGGLSESKITYINKLKAAGINIVLQKGGSFGSERAPMIKALAKGKGLFSAAQKTYDLINNDANKSTLSSIKQYMDGCLLDYENHGAITKPHYDDTETVAAFAKAQHLPDIPTKDELKEKYSAEYIKFRDRLIMEPIYAVADLLKSVKPGTPFYMEQGSGMPIGNKLDYKIYDSVVTYHLPMIYTQPLDFYHRIKSMAEYVGANKLIPTTCAGFTDRNNKVLSHALPGGLLLDYIGAASLRLAGIKHWPGAFYLDGGQLFEFCRGADLLSKVNEFYRQGKADNSITVSGLPYLEKVIKLPGKTLDLSRPQWKNYLITSAKQKEKEILLTILNYHTAEDAFVLIKGEISGNSYLREVESGRYLTVDGSACLTSAMMAKGIIVKVPLMSPGLWVLSSKEPPAKFDAIIEENIVNEYKKRKEAANQEKSDIQIGTKGNMTVGYKDIKSKTGSDTCLMISSPTQTICIKNSGGRIWQWKVGDKDLITREDVTDGAAIDLFWLPETARWSGDEQNEMRLVKCINTGTNVMVTFEQKLQNSIANALLRKTYTILGKQPDINVSIELINRTEQPLEMSYWSHNIFGNVAAESRLFMVARDSGIDVIPYGSVKNNAYSNPHTATENSKYLLKKARSNYASNIFGEYFKDDKNGVIMILPDDFMQIYRWEGKGKGSLEWMGTPEKIASGDSYKTRFSMRAVIADNTDKFKSEINKSEPFVLKAGATDKKQSVTEPKSEMQEISLSFTDRNNDNLPDGYTVYGTAKISKLNMAKDEKGVQAVRFDCRNNETWGITTGKKNRLNLKKNSKYILTFQFKISDMTTFGKWPKGFVFYLLGKGKEYAFTGAKGKGSTDGWVTAVVPFDTGSKPSMAKPYIRILCNNINGVIEVRNPSIVEVTEETMPQTRYFIMPNGDQINGSVLKL